MLSRGCRWKQTDPNKRPRLVAAGLMKCGALTCILAAAAALGSQAEQPGATPAVAATAPLSTKAATAGGTEAVRSIDWDAVTTDSPIPPQMPAASSDDPLEAGFAPEWAERAFKLDKGGLAPSMVTCRGVETPCHGHVTLNVRALPLLLAIMSQKRVPADRWAYAVESELRELIRTKVDAVKPTTVSRVFCNAVGCLSYLERRDLDTESSDIADGYGSDVRELIGTTHAAWRKSLGIEPRDIHYQIFVGGPTEHRISWELVVVSRGSGVPNVRKD